MSHVAVHCDKT